MLDECKHVLPVFLILATGIIAMIRLSKEDGYINTSMNPGFRKNDWSIVTIETLSWINQGPGLRGHNYSFTTFNPRIWNYNRCYFTCRPILPLGSCWQAILPVWQNLARFLSLWFLHYFPYLQ